MNAPADRMRRAARVMRERAKAVSEWNADVQPGDSLHLWVTDYDPRDPTGQTPMQRLVGGADAPWSEHIASWHPAVALAVADWLDAEAAGIGLYDALDGVAIELGGRACVSHSTHAQALAVADAFLGDS